MNQEPKNESEILFHMSNDTCSVHSAGAHTVSETGDSEYAPTIIGDCAADGSITLNPGEVKSCNPTNDDISPKLTVTKVVVNLDGGTAVVADFPPVPGRQPGHLWSPKQLQCRCPHSERDRRPRLCGKYC